MLFMSRLQSCLQQLQLCCQLNFRMTLPGRFLGNTYITSTPVIRTSIYPHMPISVTEPAVASLSHVVRNCPASCHTWITTSNALTIFHFLALGLLSPGPKFTKLGGGLQQAPLRHLAKFQPDRANGL